MNKEEIEDILEELHLVRPEILKPKAKKLFEAIMSIADERDKLQKQNKKYKEVIDKAIEYINKKAIKKEIQETRNIVNIIYSLKLNNYEFIELEDILKGDSNE